MFLGQIFAKNAKMTLKHFSNCPNRAKFENRKVAEILVNNVNKKCSFSAFKTAKLSRFSRYRLEILYINLSTSVLSYISRFCLKTQKNEKKTENIFLCFFLNFKIIKHVNFRDSSFIAMFNFHLFVENQSVLSVTVLVTMIPAHPYF